MRLHAAVKAYELPCEVMLYGPRRSMHTWSCGVCAMSCCKSIKFGFFKLMI